ncbi:MAG: hypothetical protein J6J23_00390 [Clostridia bacterium]|nr:hypothetical protein [Clostridia bacterium]
MKCKNLIDRLSKCNPEAEVGYELKQIAYVAPDDNGEYVDLGWSGQRYGKGKVESAGIFLLVSKYKTTDSEELKEEVNAVFSTRKKAEKMGKWLVETSKIEPFEQYDDCSERIYVSYHIRHMLII